MKVIKKETIIKIDHKPNEKKKRVKSNRGLAVKNVLKDLLKMSLEQKAIAKIPNANGMIFSEKNSFLENKFWTLENDSSVLPVGNFIEIKILIKEPPKK